MELFQQCKHQLYHLQILLLQIHNYNSLHCSEDGKKSISQLIESCRHSFQSISNTLIDYRRVESDHLTSAHIDSNYTLPHKISVTPELSNYFKRFWLLLNPFTEKNGPEYQLNAQGFLKLNMRLNAALFFGIYSPEFKQHMNDEWEFLMNLYGSMTKHNFMNYIQSALEIIFGSNEPTSFAAFCWAILDSIGDFSQSIPQLRHLKDVKCITKETETNVFKRYFIHRKQQEDFHHMHDKGEVENQMVDNNTALSPSVNLSFNLPQLSPSTSISKHSPTEFDDDNSENTESQMEWKAVERDELYPISETSPNPILHQNTGLSNHIHEPLLHQTSSSKFSEYLNATKQMTSKSDFASAHPPNGSLPNQKRMDYSPSLFHRLNDPNQVTKSIQTTHQLLHHIHDYLKTFGANNPSSSPSQPKNPIHLPSYDDSYVEESWMRSASLPNHRSHSNDANTMTYSLDITQSKSNDPLEFPLMKSSSQHPLSIVIEPKPYPRRHETDTPSTIPRTSSKAMTTTASNESSILDVPATEAPALPILSPKSIHRLPYKFLIHVNDCEYAATNDAFDRRLNEFSLLTDSTSRKNSLQMGSSPDSRRENFLSSAMTTATIKALSKVREESPPTSSIGEKQQQHQYHHQDTFVKKTGNKSNKKDVNMKQLDGIQSLSLGERSNLNTLSNPSFEALKYSHMKSTSMSSDPVYPSPSVESITDMVRSIETAGSNSFPQDETVHMMKVYRSNLTSSAPLTDDPKKNTLSASRPPSLSLIRPPSFSDSIHSELKFGGALEGLSSLEGHHQSIVMDDDKSFSSVASLSPSNWKTESRKQNSLNKMKDHNLRPYSQPLMPSPMGPTNKLPPNFILDNESDFKRSPSPVKDAVFISPKIIPLKNPAWDFGRAARSVKSSPWVPKVNASNSIRNQKVRLSHVESAPSLLSPIVVKSTVVGSPSVGPTNKFSDEFDESSRPTTDDMMMSPTRPSTGQTIHTLEEIDQMEPLDQQTGVSLTLLHDTEAMESPPSRLMTATLTAPQINEQYLINEIAPPPEMSSIRLSPSMIFDDVISSTEVSEGGIYSQNRSSTRRNSEKSSLLGYFNHLKDVEYGSSLYPPVKGSANSHFLPQLMVNSYVSKRSIERTVDTSTTTATIHIPMVHPLDSNSQHDSRELPPKYQLKDDSDFKLIQKTIISKKKKNVMKKVKSKPILTNPLNNKYLLKLDTHERPAPTTSTFDNSQSVRSTVSQPYMNSFMKIKGQSNTFPLENIGNTSMSLNRMNFNVEENKIVSTLFITESQSYVSMPTASKPIVGNKKELVLGKYVDLHESQKIVEYIEFMNKSLNLEASSETDHFQTTFEDIEPRKFTMRELYEQALEEPIPPWIPLGTLRPLEHDRSNKFLGWKEKNWLNKHYPFDPSKIKLTLKHQDDIKQSFEDYMKNEEENLIK